MIESQIVARVLPSKCREAVKVLLQEVYGYEDFRNLEVYDDLFRGKEKLGQCKKLRGKFINCYLCLQIHSLWS